MRQKDDVNLQRADGYRNMKDLIKAGTKIHAWDKVYMDYMGKAIVHFPGRNSAARGRNEYSGSTY